MSRTNRQGSWRIPLLAATIVFFASSAGVLSAGGSLDDQKTAEQAYKNIQVLKGMPESQLIGAMSYMEASVGAKDCGYCHVRSGEREMAWEKDDNPKKQTARKMIQMVLDVNKTSFEGRSEVTCYTCHQGREHPVGIPSLPLVAANPEPQMQRPSGKVPTPTEIGDKYVQAVGGKEAADKFSAVALKGTQTGQIGAGMQVEVYWKAPDKFFLAVTTQGGVFSQGYDGSTGWTQGRMGTREMSASELERMRDLESMYSPIKIREPFPRMRLAGRDKVGASEAWVLMAQDLEHRFERLYFDTETGLLLRRVVLTRTMIGTIPEQIDFADYREIDGVRLPYTIRMTGLSPRNSWDQKFETIQRDPGMADSKFSKPATAENRPPEQR